MILLYFAGQLSHKVDEPSYVISMTIKGKSVDEKSCEGKKSENKSSCPKPAINGKRKRSETEKEGKSHKVYVIESDSE